MPHRSHLFSLRIAHALRESCLGEIYTRERFGKDLLAGLTVGIIAIPLSMALAIASGVAPQYGLYTAIISGFLIALTGGSRFSISGPTAAFVVILYPIANQYGLGGLLLASVMAGCMLIGMAVLRLGRLIEYIPEAVTLGFTGGIAIVIATLQLKDFMGVNIAEMPEHYVNKLVVLFQHLPQTSWPSVAVAGLTLLLMFAWPRLKTAVPPHLPAVIIGSLLSLWFIHHGYHVDTIGSRFTYQLPGGLTGNGIPPYLPAFTWPWHQPGPEGKAFVFSWQLVMDLLPAAFAIAMLGAIESLLCAVVLDGMTGKRHSANSELLGQGIGNVITPFFGGITATAALARSAANFKAGAQSPISAMIHALVVLSGLVFLAPLLAWLPMPALAGMLIVVAWNMSEARKSVHLVKTAPLGDIVVFFTCLFLTVFFDMVIAITAGILLSTLLFMKDIAAMTKVVDITHHPRLVAKALPEGWLVFRISGPLFFAAADRVFSELALLAEKHQGVILYMEDVPMIDAGGLSALNKLVEQGRRDGMQIWLTDLQLQPRKALEHARIKPITGLLSFYPGLPDALSEFHVHYDVA